MDTFQEYAAVQQFPNPKFQRAHAGLISGSRFSRFAIKYWVYTGLLGWLLGLSACQTGPEHPQYYPLETDTPNWDSLLVFTDSMLYKTDPGQIPPGKQIELHLLRAACLTPAGENDKRLQSLLEAKLITAGMDSPYEKALTDYELANFFIASYLPALGIPYAENAYAFFQENQEYAEFGKVAQKLGQSSMITDKFAQSVFYFEQAIDFYKSQQDTILTVSVLMDLGFVQIKMDQLEAAKQTSQKALLLMQQNSKPELFAAEYTNLAVNYRYFDPDSAIALLEHAMNLSVPFQDSMNIIISKYNLANSLADTKRFATASSIYDEVEDYCKRNKVAIGIPLVLMGRGNILFQQQQYSASIERFTQGLEIFDQMGTTSFNKGTYPYLDEAYLQIGQPQKAQEVRNKLEQVEQQERDQQLAAIVELNKKTAAIEGELFKKQTLQTQESALQVRNKSYQIIFAILILFSMLASTITWQRLRVQKSRNSAVMAILEKYKTPTLPEKTDPDSSLVNALLELFEQQAIFLDPTLKVESVIQQLNTDYPTLNHLLKSHFDSNFPSFVNHYRTSYAQALLLNSEYPALTLEQIAAKSGFGTRQAFYNAFQKRYGVTPGQMRAAMQRTNPI